MAPNNQSRMTAMLRRAGPPAFGIIFMGFFLYFARAGPNGVLAYREYDRQLEARQKEYAELDRKRSELRNRVEQLDPRRANPRTRAIATAMPTAADTKFCTARPASCTV